MVFLRHRRMAREHFHFEGRDFGAGRHHDLRGRTFPTIGALPALSSVASITVAGAPVAPLAGVTGLAIGTGLIEVRMRFQDRVRSRRLLRNRRLGHRTHGTAGASQSDRLHWRFLRLTISSTALTAFAAFAALATFTAALATRTAFCALPAFTSLAAPRTILLLLGSQSVRGNRSGSSHAFGQRIASLGAFARLALGLAPLACFVTLAALRRLAVVALLASFTAGRTVASFSTIAALAAFPAAFAALLRLALAFGTLLRATGFRRGALAA
jgi:hypothetical protein